MIGELRLTVLGIPRTKKNHGRIVPRGGRHIMLPSAVWSEWCKQVAPQLEAAMKAAGMSPIEHKVNCRALFVVMPTVATQLAFTKDLLTCWSTAAS